MTKYLYFYDYVTHKFKERDFAPDTPELPSDYPATEIEPPEEKQFYDRIFENGEWQYVLKSEAVIQKTITDAVQAHMDKVAQSKGYDNIFTCIGYANSTVPSFKAEAEVAIRWRDAVWLKCHELLDKFHAGEIGVMTVDEVIAQLPEINWE